MLDDRGRISTREGIKQISNNTIRLTKDGQTNKY